MRRHSADSKEESRDFMNWKMLEGTKFAVAKTLVTSFMMTCSDAFHDPHTLKPRGTQEGAITYQKHQHEGPHIDDQEKEGYHGQGEDPTNPPVLPSTDKFVKSALNNTILKFQCVCFHTGFPELAIFP